MRQSATIVAWQVARDIDPRSHRVSCAIAVASSSIAPATGETLTITDRGRPVAVLAPVDRRSTFISRELFERSLSQADPSMAAKLRDLFGGETTDDLPLS